MTAAPKPSRFVFKESHLVAETTIGPTGGTILLPEDKTSVAGIRILIPAQALADETTVRIFRDTGELALKSGKASGTILRIDCGPRNQFNQPVEIEIPYQAQNLKKGTITGYAIDDDGLLAPLSVKLIDREKSKLILSTLIPLRFTWVFTES